MVGVQGRGGAGHGAAASQRPACCGVTKAEAGHGAAAADAADLAAILSTTPSTPAAPPPRWIAGGVFVVMSYGWGWAVDGDKPDTGDWVGTAIVITGVLLAWFWPRG